MSQNGCRTGCVLKRNNASSSCWTSEENKRFETLLAQHFNDPRRFDTIAESLGNRSVAEIEERYRALEEDVSKLDAGYFRFPEYQSSDSDEQMVKKPREAMVERRKGVPWTEEEHRQFLLGLAKYGKGDWRSISRNYVITRTPTQVASHAQKYFIRLNSMNKKDKRRASIHDIAPPPPEPPKQASSPMSFTFPNIPSNLMSLNTGYTPNHMAMQNPLHLQVPAHSYVPTMQG